MTAGNYRIIEVRLVEVRPSHDKSLTSGYTQKVVSKDPNSGGFGGGFASLV